jgi:hypothetical protein
VKYAMALFFAETRVGTGSTGSFLRQFPIWFDPHGLRDKDFPIER